AKLLYGGGLRLLECARLRVKDVDFAQQQIVVHDGKGAKDRVTILPGCAHDNDLHPRPEPRRTGGAQSARRWRCVMFTPLSSLPPPSRRTPPRALCAAHRN